MTLYPYSVVASDTLTQTPNLIEQGCLTVVPIDMTANHMMSILVAQAANTQDYSLRAWISTEVDGIPIGEYYTLLKVVGLPMIIYREGQTPPSNTIPILVPEGYYFLNVLNLVNSQNYFSFAQTILA